MNQSPSPSFAERFIDFWFTHQRDRCNAGCVQTGYIWKLFGRVDPALLEFLSPFGRLTLELRNST